MIQRWTYQVPDIAWLKVGGGGGRRTQRSEGGAFKKREQKDRLDKEKKQVRSMLREERFKNNRGGTFREVLGL